MWRYSVDPPGDSLRKWELKTGLGHINLLAVHTVSHGCEQYQNVVYAGDGWSQQVYFVW